jgi:hypothetical protein
MLTTYRLPYFLDYLETYYLHLYQKYAGRLMELFPSLQQNDQTLFISKEDADDVDDERIIQLWKEFTLKR